MRDRPVRLCVEPLEERCVLSTVRLIGGNLFITADKTGGPITLTAVADNTFRLSGTASGTFTASGNIFIIGSDAPDTVTVNLGPFNYAGNLFVFTKNGNDAINVSGTGKIGGNLNLLTGLGDDGVTVSGQIGGTVTVHSQGGRDTFTFGNGSSLVGGDLTVTNAALVNLGGGADRINGNVDINSTLVNTGVTVNTSSGLTVGGNLFITTGAGADVVNFAAGTVNGTVSVNLGEGANRVNNGGALTVGGDFDVFGGAGNDSVALAAGTTVNGSARLDLGEGANDLSSLSNAFIVQGNLNVFLGNGNNPPFTVGGSVAGDLGFRVGNGNNNVTVAGPVAGNFNWNSGNGNDTLTLALSPAVPLYQARVQFGNGDDVFATTGTGQLTGSVDGGRRFFGNVFNPSAGTVFVSPFTVSNFP
jgi:hypothetical protein